MSLLIESLMLKISLPSFYFQEDNDGNKQVIDGLQRLSSIYSYINGEFRLRGLQYLTDFNGVLYHDLPKKYRTRIEETQLAVNTLDSRCHDLVKFDVFRRVNTGGVPLKFPGNPQYYVKPKDAQELCLRFVAFYRRYDPETGALKDLEALTTMLDKTILELNKESIGEFCTLAETFGYSMERCYALLGDAAFSKQGMNHIINKPLFVSWSVVLAHSETERWSLEEMRNMEFNRLTILSTGANAAGKSSVIQALLLLSHTSEFMVNRGEAWSEESIDVNQVLGIQVGAPNALICQNPTEDEAFDFAFDLRADGKQHIFQYAVDKTSPLDLKIKKGQPFPDTEIQYLNAERIGPRMV